MKAFFLMRSCFSFCLTKFFKNFTLVPSETIHFCFCQVSEVIPTREHFHWIFSWEILCGYTGSKNSIPKLIWEQLEVAGNLQRVLFSFCCLLLPEPRLWSACIFNIFSCGGHVLFCFLSEGSITFMLSHLCIEAFNLNSHVGEVLGPCSCLSF